MVPVIFSLARCSSTVDCLPGGGCTVDDLVTGAAVAEAELDDSGTVLAEIKLGTEGDCHE